MSTEQNGSKADTPSPERLGSAAWFASGWHRAGRIPADIARYPIHAAERIPNRCRIAKFRKQNTKGEEPL